MRPHCIIIGSGLGGLSCGVILAKNGYKVTVLEQHHQAGGCLQCFERRGAKFETGLHFVGSADKGQTLHRLLSWLEVIDDIKLHRLDPERYETLLMGGTRFELANGAEALIEKLSAHFPKERDNLARYCSLVGRIAGASSLHSLDERHADVALSTRYQLSSINEVMDELFDDEMLKNVLCGEIPLLAAERDKTPFSSHAFIMDFYNQSAWRVVGGSDAIARSLQRTIERYGGEVLTSNRVTKIVCDERRATAVIVNDERLLSADLIISSIHPARLVELLDTPLIRNAYRHRIGNLPETVGCFTVYLKFKPGCQPYRNYNIFGYRNSSPWGCEHYDDLSWPLGYLYMHMCDEPQQQWASSGVILSYMRYSDVEPWQGTALGHRGSDYEAFKRERALRLIDLVDSDMPGLKDSIECFFTSTPLSYLDYTGTEKGAMYGVARDISLGVQGRVQHRTKIPNLLLAGQNINSHGILGVIVGSIVSCADILGENTILKQL